MKVSLDHFYLILSLHQFKLLSKLVEGKEHIVHKVVKSGKDTWEGIYIPTRNGMYLEFLKPDPTHPPGAMGLAMSALGKEKDSEAFLEQYSLGEKFDTTTRVNEFDRPWFTAYTFPNPTRLWILPWFMHYHGTHRARRLSRFKKTPQKNFGTIEMTVTPIQFQYYQEELWWCPLATEFSSNQITIGDKNNSLVIKKGIRQKFRAQIDPINPDRPLIL